MHITIIDGLSFLFRAYHGIRQGLTRSDGTPTNALYGFAQMLVKVVDDLKPDVCVVALDSIGPTFRKDIYPAYKANRPPPPEDLLPQLRMLQPLVEAFGLPVLRVEGVEADDIIATMVDHYCERAKNGGCQITIVSSDKDLMQLISPNVRMLDTMKDKSIGPAEVMEKFGVGPNKVIEVQALIGDSSDNVPGVKGIGPKGAADLILKFADLEGIYANLTNIEKPKLKESLETHKDLAFTSRQLVTLKRDVQLPVGWNELYDSGNFAPHLPQAADYLENELEFRSLAARLRKRLQHTETPKEPSFQRKLEPRESAPTASERSIPSPSHPVIQSPIWYDNYQTIQTQAQWQAWKSRIHQTKAVAWDTETTSLDPYAGHLVGISLAVAAGEACYIPLAHVKNDGTETGSLFGESSLLDNQLPTQSILADIQALFADPEITKIGHNLKFDWLVLARALNLTPENTGPALQTLLVNYEDTLLLSACLDAGRWNHGLNDLSLRHLGHEMVKYEDVTGKGKAQVTFDKVPLDAATRYAAEDADATWRLWEMLSQRLKEEGGTPEKGPKAIYTLEKSLLPILAAMEARGVRVNEPELRRLSDDFATRMAALEADIHTFAGHPFNVNSPTQLATVLFDEMNLGTDRQRKNRSTAVAILEELAESGTPIAEKMMAYRTLAKLRSTYTEALRQQISPLTHRVHTSYQQIGASTGRFSSTDPNLQNIPIRTEEGRKVRKAFIPREGWVMVSADYSQIELRLLAHLSGSKGLRQAFTEGADIHAYTASLIHGIPLMQVSKEQRRAAKFINFGLVYGMGAASLAKQIGSTKDEATAWIDAYFHRYDAVKDYMEANKAFARTHGYVETLLGRRVWLPDIKNQNGAFRSNAERAAINAPLQGSNADIIKLAMPKVEAALHGHQTQLLMQVHDELVLEAHPSELEYLKTQLPRIMSSVVTLTVPLLVEVGSGPNWEEAH